MVKLSRLLGFAVVGMLVSVSAQAKVIKAAHTDTEAHPKHQALLKFAELVKEESDGRLQVEVYPSGQLGDERELVESLQTGAVQITSISNGVMSAFASPFMLLDVPFSFQDVEQARHFVDEAQPLLFEGLNNIGLHGLAMWEQGFRQLSSGERRVESVDDAKGLKLRTMEAPLHVEAWRAIGANPTPMAWGQVYSSLQTGVIDGQENPLYVVTQEKLDEVQKHVSLTNHIYDALPVIASNDWWSSLSEEDAQIIESAMAEATAYERDLAESEVQAARKELESLGVEIIEPSAEQLEGFKQASQPAVLKRVRAELGDELVDEWLSAIAE